MKAITITPKKAESTRILELDEPEINNDEVLVKVLKTGICRTDLEICAGLYGETPENCNYLVMGHESVGVVNSVGKNVSKFSEGDIVVRTVRRPCKNSCRNCSAGDNDMCITGNYSEIGIKGIHGVMVQYYKEKSDFLVKVPQNHKDVGVLLEPLSFAEKTIQQANKIQERLIWEPQNALILGSGTIGLLVTMILRDKGIETTTVARTPHGNLKSDIVEQIGGRYSSTSGKSLQEIIDINKKYDIVIESTGVAKMVYEGINFVRTNGILCLTSITGDNGTIDFPISRINLEFVLGNKSLVGVVNANMKDYTRGVKRYDNIENKWPGILRKIITNELPIEEYKKGFSAKPQDIKTVINFDV